MKIIGHKKQINLLKELACSNTVPHAMLFNGDEGIGKKLIALEFAKTFYCEKNSDNIKYYGGCNECKSCSIFDSQSIPDFYFVECSDKEQIKTENIRELLYKLNLKNFSSRNKFIIFNDAHLIKEQSANILLKTLEEPKDNTFFILITSNYSKLPITIISRCHLWFFDKLSDDEITKILKEKNITLNYKDNIKLLEGSLINLDLVLSNQSDASNMEDKINAILKGDISVATLLTNELSKNKDQLKYNISILRNIFRAKMLKETDPKLKQLFAITLENIIFSEYLIFERYINTQNVFNNIFINLLPTSYSKKIYELSMSAVFS